MGGNVLRLRSACRALNLVDLEFRNDLRIYGESEDLFALADRSKREILPRKVVGWVVRVRIAPRVSAEKRLPVRSKTIVKQLADKLQLADGRAGKILA